MLQAVGAEPKAGASGIDDHAYTSSAGSFHLEASEKEPGTVTKRISLPERIPYCVSADNFPIIATDPDNPLSFWNPCYVMFHLSMSASGSISERDAHERSI